MASPGFGRRPATDYHFRDYAAIRRETDAAAAPVPGRAILLPARLERRRVATSWRCWCLKGIQLRASIETESDDDTSGTQRDASTSSRQERWFIGCCG